MIKHRQFFIKVWAVSIALGLMAPWPCHGGRGWVYGAAAAPAEDPTVFTDPWVAIDGGRNKPEITFGMADLAFLGLHMASSCLFGGIGTADHGRRFVDGCLGGAVAGSLIYAGDKMGAYSPYYLGLAYAAKAVGSLGASMRDNLFLGYGMLDRYQFDIAGVRLSIGKPETNGGRRLDYFFLPSAIAGSMYAVASGAQWDPMWSLKLGTPVYWGNLDELTDGANLESATGFSLPTIVLNENFDGDPSDVLSHEFIHTQQYRQASFMDAVFEGKLYGDMFSKYHLKIGAEALGTVMLPFAALPHDSRPNEIEPEALEVDSNGE
ncbi:MAG: hypothetical protein HY547_10150 [Elusimicrobia bacterium]|nr:hypothetical protein [Elusimicrobiota bacterium]